MNRREFLRLTGVGAAALAAPGYLFACPEPARPEPVEVVEGAEAAAKAADRPNIIFIMSDDHASHALTCYGSKINKTPNLDRLAKEGMLFENCFCTNSICAPSRAVILTGKYSHINGVIDNRKRFDGTQQTFPKLLQKAGYQTAMVGKWHLKSSPTGFDYWHVLPGQGAYHNPVMIEMGKKKKHTGYVTDIITDQCIKWLKGRKGDAKTASTTSTGSGQATSTGSGQATSTGSGQASSGQAKPFCLMYHHKAPHRNWQPDKKHADLYKDIDIPEPETFNDDYKTRSDAARQQTMSIARHLSPRDTKGKPPENLTGQALKKWKYQRYIKDYLRCIASVDKNVGRLLKYLDESGLAENTMVIYTSDQGFYLGDHGWFDKRFMYEFSLRMPLLVRYPKAIKAGAVADAIVLNLDFAPTFLDLAGVDKPKDMQGRSMRAILAGKTPADWRTSMYYHYYEYPGAHSVKRHYGIRTRRHKLIHFYHDIDAWELYDLEKDPNELNNIYDSPGSAGIVKKLKAELEQLRKKFKDTTGPADVARKKARLS